MEEELTKEQILEKMDEIHQKRNDLLNKYGFLGGGEEINEQFEHLNHDYKNYETLLFIFFVSLKSPK